MRGSLEEGALIGWYLRDERLVAALIVGQTPEVQEELNALLRARPRVVDRGGAHRSRHLAGRGLRHRTDERRDQARRARATRASSSTSPTTSSTTPVERDVLRRYLATPGHHFVVALADGEVVGQVAAVVHRHPDLRPVELYIDEVAVAPAFRRQGIARRMLDEMFALGRDARLRRRRGSARRATTSRRRASTSRARPRPSRS